MSSVKRTRNTPEMTRALDSFCFADLEWLMALHVAVTNDLSREETVKFSLSSPHAMALSLGWAGAWDPSRLSRLRRFCGLRNPDFKLFTRRAPAEACP